MTFWTVWYVYGDDLADHVVIEAENEAEAEKKFYSIGIHGVIDEIYEATQSEILLG